MISATGKQAVAYAPWPHDPTYPVLAGLHDSALYRWHSGDVPPDAEQLTVIEVMTSPNNPDGRLRSKIITGEICGQGCLRVLLSNVE